MRAVELEHSRRSIRGAQSYRTILGRAPRERSRMTRGQGGSLPLH